ncbi:MAG: SH3 domain-containing protein [Polyangiaceae bacterium]|nr:SH3 domain-containing protein [Polyangiaceae bacterium]
MALFAKKSDSVAIEVPSAKEDRALTSKVGIVAVVGFAVGVVWPRLLGVSVGPDVPGSGSKSHDSSQKIAPPPGDSAAAPAPADSAAAEEPAAEETADAVTNKQTVVVGDGKVDGCRNKKNDKLDECGKINFDKIGKARLAELERCPAVIGLEGSIALQLTLNFEKNEVVVEGEKKKSGLPSDTIRGVIQCAAKQLKGVELDKIPHTHEKYTLVYDLAFYPPGKAPPVADETKPADEAGGDTGLGRATVSWEKALVREAPEEGKVVARLPQGTKVTVVEQKGDWFKIETSKGKKGWVYRQAIGK